MSASNAIQEILNTRREALDGLVERARRTPLQPGEAWQALVELMSHLHRLDHASRYATLIKLTQLNIPRWLFSELSESEKTAAQLAFDFRLPTHEAPSILASAMRAKAQQDKAQQA